MSKVLTITGVLNSKEELSALPLKSPIRIEFSSEPNLVNAAEYIKLLRANDIYGIGNMPSSYSEYLSEDVTRFADIKVVKEDGNVVAIYPVDTLMEKSVYRLYLNAGLISSSPIEITDSRIKSAILNVSLPVKLDVKSKTITNASGNTIFVCRISIGDSVVSENVVVDVAKGISISGVDIKFGEGSVFNTGESIELSPSERSILTEDVIIDFKTVTTGSYGEPPIKPEVISKESIQAFFNNPLVVLEKGAEEVIKAPEYEVTIRQPNKIFIDFDRAMNPDSLTIDNIELDISEAFGNTHLSKIGLYKDTPYKVKLLWKKNNKRVQLEILPLEEGQKSFVQIGEDVLEEEPKKEYVIIPPTVEEESPVSEPTELEDDV